MRCETSDLLVPARAEMVIEEKALGSAEIERMVGLVLSDVCTTRSPRIPLPAEVESLLRTVHH
ncbi:MAG: hypothetical protein QHH27_08720 [Clostridia bacterium]|nr:hypothetical protein [Clostridia bacterium]MDH7573613.1 hypothetical protein [Clostridia bacterium]